MYTIPHCKRLFLHTHHFPYMHRLSHIIPCSLSILLLLSASPSSFSLIPPLSLLSPLSLIFPSVLAFYHVHLYPYTPLFLQPKHTITPFPSFLHTSPWLLYLHHTHAPHTLVAAYTITVQNAPLSIPFSSLCEQSRDSTQQPPPPP